MEFFAFVQKHCGPFLVLGYGYLADVFRAGLRRHNAGDPAFGRRLTAHRRPRRTALRYYPQVSGSARRLDARDCSSEKLVISLPYRRRSLCSAADSVWKNS